MYITVYMYHNICSSTHPHYQYKYKYIVFSLSIEMAQKYVDDKVANNKVMVFSKSYCPYCKMAKDVLREVGVKYDLVELDERGRDIYFPIYLV